MHILPFRRLTGVIALCLLLAGCVKAVPTPPLTPPAPTATPVPAITAYFTRPGESRPGRLEKDLTASIDSARQSVDVAMFNLTLPSVRDSLVAAFNRGLAVRVVMESASLDGKVPQELRKAGIKALGDRREGLMHNKYLVIDGAEVWSGSLNLTASGLYEDNNNFVHITSTRLAQNYTHEFEEMFLRDQFGPDSVKDTPLPALTLNGVAVENYFAPEDNAMRALINQVKSAQHSVDILAYAFTYNALADALIERAKAGVTVRVVFEHDQITSGSGSEFSRLKQAGLDIREDGNPGLMHHKVIVVDGQTVAFGSFNFSRNADQVNDENLLIVHDPTLAAQFEQEFERVYNQANP